MSNERRDRFTFRNKWDGKELHDPDGQQDVDEGTKEKLQVSAYEKYARERLRKPEYQRLKIGLERLNRTLVLIESSWRRVSRHLTLKELENLLTWQHEIENNAESIEDVFLRGYICEQLDMIASARRFIAEEVRWDIESSKKT